MCFFNLLGKLILRFDDTNPSKEKEEYVENIKKDLKTLEVTYDILTHTSDSFDFIYERAVTMIKEGKAYVDDTGVEQMRAERMVGTENANRSNSVERNLHLFTEEMYKGTVLGQTMCLRAKIDMQAPNKTLRDPVMYRCNVATPHHRTGTKYKCYPTYDFACPIVDSLEGVTHALRTTEYHDRDAQYGWFLKAMNLRHVHIWDYSRLNFKYTVLSKRKLNWFVSEGLVDGWTDPRFPTVQGIVRRGLKVEALRSFILAQGASKSDCMMEWDKIWAENAKILDREAFRYTAISTENNVVLTVKGLTGDKLKDVPLIPKSPEAGNKQITLGDSLLIEQDDAKEMEEKEEITLMNWGNCIVDSITRNAEGLVTAIAATLNLDGDVKKTKKKACV